MDVKRAIEERRAYRSLDKINIPLETLIDLAKCASLSPSCFNNQPWRFIFVNSEEKLLAMREALSKGNEWAYDASAFIAVCSKPDLDCMLKDGRQYYAFDVGISVGILMLRATELDLVAHPIAGYSPDKVKEILNIPKEYEVITLLVVGKHSKDIKPTLTEKQIKAEKERPPRLQLKEFAFLNNFGNPLE
ncbi:MAG: nitroreductase family protein [Synergistetes bacterium]|nr:nitroreductase family protein [Synergistota bacterium]MCX8128279.1 nitroreductase family protein [Synergistota bacterium]MDW8192592.1 nitroreductase family protein [Synergistota bacterium]